MCVCVSLSVSVSVTTILRGLYRGDTTVIIITCCVHNDIHGRRPWIINNYGSSGRKTLFTLKLTTIYSWAVQHTQTNWPDAFTYYGIILLLLLLYTHIVYNNTMYIYTRLVPSAGRLAFFPGKNAIFNSTRGRRRVGGNSDSHHSRNPLR